MTARWVSAGDGPSAPRGAHVVCLVCDGDDPAGSLAQLLANTDEQVPIILAAEEAQMLDVLAARVRQRELWLLAAGRAVLRQIVAASAPADVVLLSHGARVGPEWLERLQGAAHSDSTVVSATALADHAGPLSLGIADPHAKRAVASGSLRAYPRIGRARSHCVYLRRRGVELLDGRWSTPGADLVHELSELSRQCSERGMVHVAADDVVISCEPVEEPEPDEWEREEYEDEQTVLHRALRVAELAVGERLSVTLDGRSLGGTVDGTQRHIVELALALARSGRAAVRVVVRGELGADLERALRREEHLELVSEEIAEAGIPRSRIVHRPQQVFIEPDLTLLRLLGERIVVTHQDLIGYRNHTYHDSVETWRQFRRMTRITLAVADLVVFFSEHARRDALVEGLVEEAHAETVGIGADSLWISDDETSAPVAAPRERFLLCLGADYRHKNRPFAIRLLAELCAAHGWRGRLVFAGAHVPHGSSRTEEQAIVARDPALAETVIDLGPVTPGEKAWLYEHADAVVFPTLYEGFGLIPFEAARAGVPCLFAPQTALIDLLGEELATLVAWDASLSAAAVAPLLSPGSEREHHVRALQDATVPFRWEPLTARLLTAYERAIRNPPRAAAEYGWQELEREAHIRDLTTRVLGYMEIGDALMLAKRDGWLDDDTRQGLMRVAARPVVRRATLWPFRLLGRVRSKTRC